MLPKNIKKSEGYYDINPDTGRPYGENWVRTNPKEIEELKSQINKYKQADVNKEIPYQENTFDKVVSRQTNWMTMDAFKNIHNVLKPGGRLEVEGTYDVTTIKQLENLGFTNVKIEKGGFERPGFSIETVKSSNRITAEKPLPIREERVLDLGGGFDPNPRATDVVDMYSYDSNIAILKKIVAEKKASLIFTNRYPMEKLDMVKESYKQSDFNSKKGLPYKKGTFDEITSHTAVTAFGDTQAYKNMYDVLKEGGKVELTTSVTPDELGSAQGGVSSKNVRLDELRKAGFTNIKVEPYERGSLYQVEKGKITPYDEVVENAKDMKEALKIIEPISEGLSRSQREQIVNSIWEKGENSIPIKITAEKPGRTISSKEEYISYKVTPKGIGAYTEYGGVGEISKETPAKWASILIPGFQHRGIMHSWIMALILAAPLYYYFGLELGMVSLISYISHLIMDMKFMEAKFGS